MNAEDGILAGLQEELDEALQREDELRRLADLQSGRTLANPAVPSMGGGRKRNEPAAKFADARTGQTIYAYQGTTPTAEPQQKLANGEPMPTLGAWIHSTAAGRPKCGLTESQIQLSGGSMVGGSYLVPAE